MHESFKFRNINIMGDFPLFRCICYTVMKSDLNVGRVCHFQQPHEVVVSTETGSDLSYYRCKNYVVNRYVAHLVCICHKWENFVGILKVTVFEKEVDF